MGARVRYPVEVGPKDLAVVRLTLLPQGMRDGWQSGSVSVLTEPQWWHRHVPSNAADSRLSGLYCPRADDSP